MNRAHAWLTRWLYGAALLALAALWACGGGSAPPRAVGQPLARAPATTAVPVPDRHHDDVVVPYGIHAGIVGAPTRATLGFKSPARLHEHFAKHGAEFGRITEAEYLRRAQALRDAPVGGPILELRRPDGVVSRYDRDNGTFLAFDADGTIRTCFRPNDGEAYFKRQANRRLHR